MKTTDGENRGPKKAGELARTILKGLGVGGRGKSGRIQAAWLNAAGEALAVHTRPSNLARNVLTVEVDSSALMGELAGFRKDELLRRIKESFPGLAVLDIKFRIGRF
jgi:predicted nucleic acid-binding Zn ribbon protein